MADAPSRQALYVRPRCPRRGPWQASVIQRMLRAASGLMAAPVGRENIELLFSPAEQLTPAPPTAGLWGANPGGR